MNEENRVILQMLKDGKISVEEAEKLMNEAGAIQEDQASCKCFNKRFLRILIVEDQETKVNINIPLALAEVALKLVPKEALSIEGTPIPAEEILSFVQDGQNGDLVNIDTIDKGKQVKVKICIE